MTTIFVMFLVGYVFHALYKLIDRVIVLLKEKRNEMKGESDK